MKRVLLFLLFFSNVIVSDFNSTSVDAWYEKAKKRNPNPKAQVAREEPIISFEEFQHLLQKYIDYQKRFLINSPWYGEKFNVEKLALKNDFKDELDDPFALKLSINSGGSGYFWGDLHGDVAALAIALKKLADDNILDDSFKILKPETYFFFLGDMVDRGAYQLDMLSLLFTLVLQNHGKVFLIRGNHEDLDQRNRYGFNEQLKDLFKLQYPEGNLIESNPIYYSIALLYNLMPDVAFVGCNNNYMQCCHGGIEIRYDPKKFLAQPEKLHYQLIRKPITFADNDFFKRVISSHGAQSLHIDKSAHRIFIDSFYKPAPFAFEKKDFGFLWGDFNNDAEKKYNTYYTPTRGLFAGKEFTRELLNHYSTHEVRVRGIMRAHQHNPTLPGIFTQANTGVYPMWQGSVITNLSTSLFRGVIAFNRITFFDDYGLWRLTNYSGKGNTITTEKDNLIKDWKNNYEPPVEETPLLEPQPAKSISQENEDFFEKFEDELEKENPDYNKAQNFLKSIKEDPQDNNAAYLKAKKLLDEFAHFLKALEILKKGDYMNAGLELSYFLDEGVFKFKAREYYAKTVIMGTLKDEYGETVSFLNDTLGDKSASVQDQIIAERLINQINVLSNQKTK